MKEKPSAYFERQCFISADPDETAAPLIIEHVGAQCFLWATDFPHGDHSANWKEHLERFIEPLQAPARRALLGENVKRLYCLE